jgi:hypothetical protein
MDKKKHFFVLIEHKVIRENQYLDAKTNSFSLPTLTNI